MINKIGKITIYVNDQGEAKEFWTKKMNFVVKGEYPMGPNMTWLEVGPSEDEFTTFVLYNKSLMEKQNGVDVTDIMKMPYGSMFTFKDQDGNPYIIREDK